MAEQVEPIPDPLSGPEGQLFREDAREIRVSLKWLQQHIQAFGAHQDAGRDDWSHLITQVTHELELLQRRAINLQEAIQALSAHSSGTGDADSDEKEGSSGADTDEKTDVSDEELCCC